ncbi:hypothetical protein CKC_03630 [Candidatus Liberibacter solanacearum CLso-ZC1]|uniref:Lipoprotein n=1 Tax=Liberibacter solanacearum (strain CLso-ZC1) TaxID=658172 RepID=E4UBG9_LIBSC|nr:hypothetical protein CKC_03630 [Candidatus Liberibacter solanacearum CLso-ZC1]
MKVNFTKNKRRLYIIAISITLSSCFDDGIRLSDKDNEESDRITLEIYRTLIQTQSELGKDLVEEDQKISNIKKQLESSEEEIKNLTQIDSDNNWSSRDELLYTNRGLKKELSNWTEIRNKTLDRKKTLDSHLKK